MQFMTEILVQLYETFMSFGLIPDLALLLACLVPSLIIALIATLIVAMIWPGSKKRSKNKQTTIDTVQYDSVDQAINEVVPTSSNPGSHNNPSSKSRSNDLAAFLRFIWDELPVQEEKRVK